MSLHLINLLFQTLVLHLTHNGVELLQSLCFWVIGNLNLWTFYLLLKLLMILCLTHFIYTPILSLQYCLRQNQNKWLPALNVSLTCKFFWWRHISCRQAMYQLIVSSMTYNPSANWFRLGSHDAIARYPVQADGINVCSVRSSRPTQPRCFCTPIPTDTGGPLHWSETWRQMATDPW